MKSNNYFTFGLNISTPLSFSGLLPAHGEPDVIVRYGAVPKNLPGAKQEGPCFQAAPDHLLLSINNVAKYYISHGKEIIIERDPGAKDDAVRVFLFGSALGTIFLQRGLLPLHGTGIEVNGKGVIFLGHSGRGKSTLAAIFSKRGYKILADDICVVSFNGHDKPMIHPGEPVLKLWPDVIKKLYGTKENIRPMRNGLKKYIIPLSESFFDKPLSFNHGYILSPHNKAEFNLTPIKGGRKLFALKSQTYRRGFLEGLGKKVDHFALCSKIASHISLTRVNRPDSLLLLNELVDILEDDFE